MGRAREKEEGGRWEHKAWLCTPPTQHPHPSNGTQLPPPPQLRFHHLKALPGFPHHWVGKHDPFSAPKRRSVVGRPHTRARTAPVVTGLVGHRPGGRYQPPPQPLTSRQTGCAVVCEHNARALVATGQRAGVGQLYRTAGHPASGHVPPSALRQVGGTAETWCRHSVVWTRSRYAGCAGGPAAADCVVPSLSCSRPRRITGDEHGILTATCD